MCYAKQQGNKGLADACLKPGLVAAHMQPIRSPYADLVLLL